MHLSEQEIIRRQSLEEIMNDGISPLFTEMGKQLKPMALDGRKPVFITQEAATRLRDARMALLEKYKNHRLATELAGILLRIGVNAWKVSALIAMSEGRRTIELTDMLFSIREMGQWVESLLRLVDGIVSSDWRRKTELLFE